LVTFVLFGPGEFEQMIRAVATDRD